MLPKVPIIIFTYNKSQFLPVAIDSMLTQTYSAIEVIVVDDGSSDDFFPPTKIESQMHKFNVRPDVGSVHCEFYQVDEKGYRLNKVRSV